MPYIEFTEEQKLRANAVDLPEFLRRQGEQLVRSGPEYRLTSDHSVTVSGNRWYDHAEERGGGPVSLMKKLYGLSYPEAVTRLLNGEQGESQSRTQKPAPREKKEFIPRQPAVICGAPTLTCWDSEKSTGTCSTSSFVLD